MLSDNDPLVAGFFTVNGGIDIDNTAVPLGKLGDLHSCAVRDLPVQAPQELLPDDLRHHLPLRLIGGGILREQERTGLGILFAYRQQFLHAVPGLRGNGNNRVKGRRFGVDIHDLQKLILFHGINLIDNQNAGAAAGLNLLDQAFFLGPDGGDGLYHQQGKIHIRDGFPGHIHHEISQLGSGPVEARRIHKDKLGFPTGENAADPVSGGLRLIGNNGDLLPHQVVC